jgi:hypothetical protein
LKYPKPPSFHADKAVRDACQGKTAKDNDIEVNDMGEVGVSDTCVAISQRRGHKVRWRPKSRDKSVSIVFILAKDQPVPFERMSCSKPDGARLCVLTTCPDPCETSFLAGYEPKDPSSSDAYLNYYYYSVGLTSSWSGSARKAGGDPGIRIDP